MNGTTRRVREDAGDVWELSGSNAKLSKAKEMQKDEIKLRESNHASNSQRGKGNSWSLQKRYRPNRKSSLC